MSLVRKIMQAALLLAVAQVGFARQEALPAPLPTPRPRSWRR